MTKAIARKLGISYRTVNGHLRNLCARYGAKNSVHLIYLTHPVGNGTIMEHPALTRHENGILHMIMRGISITDIAIEKCISQTTARLHRERIREKTNTNCMRAAAALILNLSTNHAN